MFICDVVKKVYFVGGSFTTLGGLRWWKDPHSMLREIAVFLPLFCRGSFLVNFLENKIVAPGCSSVNYSL